MVSCGQEKEIILWKHNIGEYSILKKFPKQDELRCLDFVSENCQLLIGTGNGLVLTQNLSEYLSMYSGALGYDEMGEGYDDYYDEGQ